MYDVCDPGKLLSRSEAAAYLKYGGINFRQFPTGRPVPVERNCLHLSTPRPTVILRVSSFRTPSTNRRELSHA